MKDLAQAIIRALERPNPTLFAGAGVGRRVDLPDWPGFMDHLAAVCEKFEDPLSAQLIRRRSAAQQFLAAATVYKTCEMIPQGERWKQLADPFDREFKSDLIDRLSPLINLGFSAVVTTNYDHSLHEAIAKNRGWCRPVERGDGSLRGASLIAEFFIARIHGRAEIPTSMIVDTSDYDRLNSDTDYLDFLLDVLRNRSCLFVGFSFADPSFNHIFNLFEERFGPVYPSLHSALMPAGDRDVIYRLRSLNIDVLTYDPDDGHRQLWQAVRDASEGKKKTSVISSLAVTSSPGLHRFMAFAYAQVRGSKQSTPVTTLVQDGIVLSELSPDRAVSERDLAEKLRSLLRVSFEEALALVSTSLGRLFSRHQIDRTAEGVRIIGAAPDALNVDLESIAKDVVDRMRVRGSADVGPAELEIARGALERVLLARAWDLAAHFAGSASGWGTDLNRVVERVVSEAAGYRRLVSLPALTSALLDVLQAPEDRQAPALARLGRAAFGLQLALSTPRQVLFQKFSLPEKLYLDSNVLMPAITDGHPLRPAYAEALARLAEAGEKTGSKLDIAVGEQFLNEIVSHRYIARQLINELDLEQPDKLAHHVIFYGATNTNVFVAAYASAVGRQRHSLLFEDFLRQAAPYENEAELIAYLEGSGIVPARMEFFEDNQEHFTGVLNPLLEGYAHNLSFEGKSKPAILVRHEAAQLAQLRSDLDSGRRSVFVTADTRLRRILHQDSRLHDLASMTVSQIGLVALVDVMVGFEADSRSVARLVWAQPQSDAERSLFDYFVALGLRDYQEGMAMEMQEAARVVATSAAQEVRHRQLNLYGKEVGEIAASARFLDRYEDLFFRNWREAIERREAEEKT